MLESTPSSDKILFIAFQANSNVMQKVFTQPLKTILLCE